MYVFWLLYFHTEWSKNQVSKNLIEKKSRRRRGVFNPPQLHPRRTHSFRTELLEKEDGHRDGHGDGHDADDADTTDASSLRKRYLCISGALLVPWVGLLGGWVWVDFPGCLGDLPRGSANKFPFFFLRFVPEICHHKEFFWIEREKMHDLNQKCQIEKKKWAMACGV